MRSRLHVVRRRCEQPGAPAGPHGEPRPSLACARASSRAAVRQVLSLPPSRSANASAPADAAAFRLRNPARSHRPRRAGRAGPATTTERRFLRRRLVMRGGGGDGRLRPKAARRLGRHGLRADRRAAADPGHGRARSWTSASCRSPSRTTSTTSSTWTLIEGMAELGILGIVIPEEYGGAGPRLRRRGARLRGDRARRGGVPDADLGARRAQLALAAASTATEEQKQRYLVPQAKRREARLLRADRARRRLRRRRDALDRAPRGRRLRPQRPEELDLVRDGRRPPARLREDRSRRRSTRASRAFVVERGVAGRHDARDRAQARHLGRLDRRALLRERRGARGEPASARRARASRSRCTALDQGRFTVAAGAVRRHPRLPRALGRVRARAGDVRPADRPATSSSRT